MVAVAVAVAAAPAAASVAAPRPAVALPPRLADWPERLAAYIEAHRHLPFAWGQNDCAMFAAGAVRALTGVRLAALLPGVWSNVHDAERMLRDLAGLEAAATRMLGQPVRGQAARFVARGGIVCVPLEGRATLGVLATGSAWCAPGERGLVFRPAAEVQVSWSV